MTIIDLPIQNLLTGIIIARLISLIGYRYGLLSISGAWAATFVGGLTFGFGGMRWAILMVLFFLFSSLIPYFRDGFGVKVVKRPKRRWKQVLVNGGPGLVVLIIGYFFETGIDLWLVYGGMIAAVTSDTWATEIAKFDGPLHNISKWFCRSFS